MRSIHSGLQKFIEATKARGASDEGLAAILSRQGWPLSEVYAGLGEYWARVTGIEIPQRTGHGESSRDAFLYLLAFSTLAVWACAMGALLFDLINYILPDMVSTLYPVNYRNVLTWKMAPLAVAFPIYLLVMRTIVTETNAEPERLQSGVRKWLTWIALFLTATSMIGDLICFLGYFLSGEISARFVLKCLVVFSIAGGIFFYYIVSLRARDTEAPEEYSRDFLFGTAATMAAATVFLCSMAVTGTPTVQRAFQADSRRVQDIRRLA